MKELLTPKERYRLNAFIWLNAYICIVFAIYIALGWIGNFYWLLRLIEKSAPALPLDSILFFLAGISIIFRLNSFKPLMNVSTIFIILITALSLTEYIFNLNWSLEKIFNMGFLSKEVELHGRLAPNTSVAFLFFGLVMLFQSNKVIIKFNSPVLSYVGILIIGIAYASIFGYLTEVEVGYGWGTATRISLLTSMGLIPLGLSSTLLVWEQFLEKSMGLKQLWQSIIFYSTIGILVVAIISSAFTVLPFYDLLKKNEEQRIEELATQKAKTVEQFIQQIQAEIRQVNTDVKKKSLDLILQNTQYLVGVTQVNKEGHIVKEYGQKIIGKLKLPDKVSDKIELKGPYELENQLYFLAYNTSNYSPDLLNVYIIRAQALNSILSLKSAHKDSEPTAYLATKNLDLIKIFRITKGVLRKSEFNQRADITAWVRKIKKTQLKLIEPIVATENPRYLAIAQVENQEIYVIISTKARALYNQINFRLVEFVGSAIVFALLASTGIFLLVKALFLKAEEIRSDREKQNLEIQKALEEKEILLREVHHRVKNNLQIISSLLRLQSREYKDPEIYKILEDSQDRVNSIALLHELLYKSKNLAGVRIDQYVNELVAHLLESYGKTEQITVINTADPVLLNLETAIPCGLIINEIVNNSIKHAFPDNQPGQIKIEFYSPEKDKYRLIIVDNGVGIDNMSNFKKSLGLRLIEKLSDQLGGSIKKSGKEGTKYVIDFTSKG